MKRKCPYCGSYRVEILGGADGNPYHETRKESAVCADCGRTLPHGNAEPTNFLNPNAIRKINLYAVRSDTEKEQT